MSLNRFASERMGKREGGGREGMLWSSNASESEGAELKLDSETDVLRDVE